MGAGKKNLVAGLIAAAAIISIGLLKAPAET